MTTIQEALAQGSHILTQARQTSSLSLEHPRLDVQILLSYVLEQERSYLYAYPERELSNEQELRWQELISRRAQGEPVAYLIGKKAFFGLDFQVDRRVLIPRPETELLVEQALMLCRERLERQQVPIVADIGTGSGAIPISLAVHEARLPSVYASDISPEALAVARLNCRHYHVEDRVHLLQGDLLSPLPEPVDLLLANLPYVGTTEQAVMTSDVLNYEPGLALFSGPEGLDLLERLLAEARQEKYLRSGAILLLEIGYRQGAVLSRLASKFWPRATITLQADYAGWDRVLKIETES